VALHLIGEQNIPNYIAIKHLDAETHILLATKKMADVAKRLKGSLIEYGPRIVIEDVADAFQLGGLIAQFTTLRQRYEGKRIALNVTGGTKLMAIALLHAFYEMKGRESFYVEAHGRNELISITKNKELPLAPCFEDAKTFVSLQTPELLSRYKDRRPSETEFAVARELRKINVDVLKRFAFFFSEIVDKYCHNRLGKEDKEAIAKKIDELRCRLPFEEAKDDFDILAEELGQELFWRFIAGRWFEVYVYEIIKKSGNALLQKMRGLRLNVPVFYENKEAQRQDRQELDLAYTDGFALCAIECKARKDISQEEVQKLENNVLRYGGTFGQGVLVSAYEQGEAIVERVKTSKNVMLVHGKDVEHLKEALLNWQPGVWMRTVK
jgi:hypothetical protein